ncbi:MAG TPA: hypothetical protein VHY37_13070 [Tepidisphaeraceae bacterium]|jgi:hypothetical protein|nr:hypothetical protein [Tepidisphaeraceae bacterium]
MSRSIINRPALAGLLVASGICAAADAQAVTSFSGITSWVGTGSNSAALLIDWNDPGNPNGDTSLVWGYHWSGADTAYTSDMIEAVVAADPHLYALLSNDVPEPQIAFGFGYNQNLSNSMVLSPTPTQTSLEQTETWNFGNSGQPNLALIPDDGGGVNDSRHATGPGQVWEEGWNVGYWALWTATESDLLANNDDASDWDAQWGPDELNGIGTQALTNGDWDGLDFDPDFDTSFNGDAPAEPTAAVVPEPAAISLFLVGSLCLLHRPRRRAAAR